MLTPEQKAEARNNAEAAKDAAAEFKVATTLLALPAAGAGILVQYGLLGAVFVALLDRQVRKAERAANDPPRGDFLSRTEAQRPRIDAEEVLRDTAFEDVGVPAAETLREAIALLSAFVRAVERAQGAGQSGREDAAKWHAEEAREFADDLEVVGDRTQSALDALARKLRQRGTEDLSPLRKSRPAKVAQERAVVPPEVRERLRKAGVRLPVSTERDLDRPPNPEDAAAALSRVGRTTATLARALRGVEFETVDYPAER